VVKVARRAALGTLGLNVLISFSPHVDAAAHFGGGIMGAAILAVFAASRHLPIQGNTRRAHVGLRVLAVALGLMFAAGLVVAQLKGRPWELDSPPALVRTELSGSGWTVDVPVGAALRASSQENEVAFGDLGRDSDFVVIDWDPLVEDGTVLDGTSELAGIQHQLQRVPEGLEMVTPPRLATDPGALPHVVVRYRYISQPDQVVDRAIGIIDGATVRVSVIGWEALPAAFEGLAVRVLESIRPASQPLPAHAP
jgi:hypothetical protein